MLSIIIATLFALTQAGSQDSCNALVLSGGSNNGAWEIGVMWGLLNYGTPTDYYWDVITGISAGAINTAGTAGWAPNETAEMVQYVSDSWRGLNNSDIWAEWPHEFHEALFGPSLLNDSAGLATIQRIVSAKTDFAKRVTVAAVDVNTGEFVRFNQTNLNYSELAQAAISSGSLPAVFPPQHFKGHVLMDGGTVWDLNIDSAVKQCMDGVVDDYSQITIDILVCGYSAKPRETVSQKVTKNIADRRDIHQYWYNTNNIQKELLAFPGVNVRYYFQERDTGCSVFSLSFNGEETWCLQEAGRRDAQSMLSIGQEAITEAVNAWTFTQSIQDEYPFIEDYIYTLLED